MRPRLKARIILFFLILVLWGLINWVPDWQHMAAGAVISALVSYLSGDLFLKTLGKVYEVKRYVHFFFSYIPLFAWEMIKANIDVAYRVIHPGLPINPGIVKVKTSLKTEAALTFLANTITLTSGTLTVDIDPDNGILYVHWIDVRTKNIDEATKIIVERFEKVLKHVFD
jgi:multicomponent Na+:H+ antiporter subunit E